MSFSSNLSSGLSSAGQSVGQPVSQAVTSASQGLQSQASGLSSGLQSGLQSQASGLSSGLQSQASNVQSQFSSSVGQMNSQASGLPSVRQVNSQGFQTPFGQTSSLGQGSSLSQGSSQVSSLATPSASSMPSLSPSSGDFPIQGFESEGTIPQTLSSQGIVPSTIQPGTITSSLPGTQGVQANSILNTLPSFTQPGESNIPPAIATQMSRLPSQAASRTPSSQASSRPSIQESTQIPSEVKKIINHIAIHNAHELIFNDLHIAKIRLEEAILFAIDVDMEERKDRITQFIVHIVEASVVINDHLLYIKKDDIHPRSINLMIPTGTHGNRDILITMIRNRLLDVANSCSEVILFSKVLLDEGGITIETFRKIEQVFNELKIEIRSERKLFR